MPYIASEDRLQYQSSLNEISELVPKDRTLRPGHMNYIISLLIEKVYGKEMRYADYNEVQGVLGCAGLELYRKKTGPYEDKAIIKNGDLSDLPKEKK
jgi:hypothetical protein